MAYDTLSFKNQQLPFLHSEKSFMRITPKTSFMKIIIELQKKIIETMNMEDNKYLSIDEKMENLSKNW